MKRRVLCVTESRATYGYVRPILKLLRASPVVDLAVVATGMHLDRRLGNSLAEVEADGPVAAVVHMALADDTPASWAKSLGIGVTGLAQAYEQLRPDVVLVAGDRMEVFAATAAAAYSNIPVAHIQSGDLSGHIDGSARHAITKLAHVHLPACEDSANRVLKMGEEPWRVHNVGAPQLDEAVHGEKYAKAELESRLGVDLSQPTLLVVQHATLVEAHKAEAEMVETMEAVKNLGLQTIVIHPNNDAGGQAIVRAIRRYENLPVVRSFQNLERKAYLSLLQHVSCLVGNSSSGILEAPSFKLAAVNVGDRQAGRMQAGNVLNAPHERKAIEAAVQTALSDKTFRERLAACVNPYGDGRSAARIARLLETIDLGPKLLDKRMTY